jgi:hypothetical protein
MIYVGCLLFILTEFVSSPMYIYMVETIKERLYILVD